MISVFANGELFGRVAANLVVQAGNEAIAERDRFDLVLQGGATPKRTHEILAADSRTKREFWQKTHVFWGDERCVPPDDSRSNYRAARESLLDSIDIPPENVHRIEGEGRDRAAAAERYAAAFPAHSDVLMLGVGDDGHTASLFPRSPALQEKDRAFVASEAPVEPRYRITIAPPAIASASRVLVLVAGASKGPALERIFDGTDSIEETPAKLVRDAHWLVDRAAAQRILESGNLDSDEIRIEE